MCKKRLNTPAHEISTTTFCTHFFIFISCKQKCKDKVIIGLDEELKAYILPVGSYWVDQDSASGVLDTVSLMKGEVVLREIYER